ncbi:MAG: peptidase M17, partial [Bacteroidota bacterium]
MNTEVLKIESITPEKDVVFLVGGLKEIPSSYFSKEEIKYINREKTDGKDLAHINRLGYRYFVWFISSEKEPWIKFEKCRKGGNELAGIVNGMKIQSLIVSGGKGYDGEILAFLEGIILGNYQFLKYKSDKKRQNSLKRVSVYSEITSEEIKELVIVTESVCHCRNMVNEPNSTLNAETFTKEVVKLGKSCGAKVEVMNRQKLESLKMGGLLAVNKASNEPPTFTIMEWAPSKAVNKNPIIFVGKGVVYDTGGMNLKPGDSMLNMKDDMAGAAAVACAIHAIAGAGLPVHVIGLMPATDNKIGPNAIVPGDVITMFKGTTVEVINTDAEGRLILADALSYASRFKPELVIDLATLTGAAVRAIGSFGIVAMQSKASDRIEKLKESGWRVFERIVEFPLWEEYGELIKSDIADLKNLGPGEAGAITAGKFLEHFTDYPYIHLDIAGPAYLEKGDSYRG